MPTATFTSSFTVKKNPVCWDGTLSAFELKLLEPLPYYALEQLRTRFLHFVTADHSLKRSVRGAVQMAYETELGTTLLRVAPPPPGLREAQICERRRYLEIDRDMANFTFLYAPALQAFEESGKLPQSYIKLLRRHLSKPYPKYRVSAVAALLCFAAAFLVAE